jgi:hypothetical protein
MNFATTTHGQYLLVTHGALKGRCSPSRYQHEGRQQPPSCRPGIEVGKDRECIFEEESTHPVSNFKTNLDQLVDRADAATGEFRRENHTLNIVVLKKRYISAHICNCFDLQVGEVSLTEGEGEILFLTNLNHDQIVDCGVLGLIHATVIIVREVLVFVPRVRGLLASLNLVVTHFFLFFGSAPWSVSKKFEFFRLEMYLRGTDAANLTKRKVRPILASYEI